MQETVSSTLSQLEIQIKISQQLLYKIGNISSEILSGSMGVLFSVEGLVSGEERITGMPRGKP